jgi:lambda repressor-like predicted transcriptional regulator
LPKYFLGKYSLNALSEGGMPKGMLRNTFKDLLPNDLFARLDKKGFSMPEAQLTQKFGSDWKDWFLSSKLDAYINRGNREKMAAKFSQLSTKELSLYFKISSLGLFLENQSS